jgi:hypothetical protein
MSADEIITKILSAGALLAGIAALIGSVRSRRAGIQSDQREALRVEGEQRRDTIADRDALIETMHEDVADLRTRVAALERDLLAEREYSRVLQDRIYRDGGTPPRRP